MVHPYGKESRRTVMLSFLLFLILFPHFGSTFNSLDSIRRKRKTSELGASAKQELPQVAGWPEALALAPLLLQNIVLSRIVSWEKSMFYRTGKNDI